MILLEATKDEKYLNGILTLQKENLSRYISPEEKSKNGFVTVHHNIAQLKEMAIKEPQMVALSEGIVVGYVLSMVKEMRHTFPEIAPMFDLFPKIEFQGKMLSQYNYVVCGQACIDKHFRGKGLVGQLYEKMKTTLSEKYEMCITEVATSNIPSLKAHRKIGFESVYTYNDGKEDWSLIVWYWR